MVDGFSTEIGYITLSQRNAEVEQYLDLDYHYIQNKIPNFIFRIENEKHFDRFSIGDFKTRFQKYFSEDTLNQILTKHLMVSEIKYEDDTLTLHLVLQILQDLYPDLIVGYELSGAYWSSTAQPLEFGGFTCFDSKNLHYGSSCNNLLFVADKADHAVETGNYDKLAEAVQYETYYVADGIKDPALRDRVKLQFGFTPDEEEIIDDCADGFKADLTVNLQGRGFEQLQIENVMGALATTLVGPDIARPNWFLTPNVLNVEEPCNSISGWLKEITDGVNT